MAQKIYPTNSEIRHAAGILRAGGLVAFPTETVYGLGANALDPEAVSKIYQAKGRPATSPLIVHVASIAMAREVVAEWPDEATALAEKFWPGPLTMVLRKQPAIPDRVTAGLPTVGIRVPRHPVALQLIVAAGIPVAAPSANAFMRLSPTEGRHVLDGLGADAAYILDAGPVEVGIESTVISLADGRRDMLRPGTIPQTQIEAIVGPLSVPEHPEAGAHASPGNHPRHYSPRTPVILTRDLPMGHGAYLWWMSELPSFLNVHMPDDPLLYARDLYSILHRLDTEGLDYIAIEPVPESEEWAGIRDRLRRASFPE